MKRIRRSPHGERGLKSRHASLPLDGYQSLSSWRAWIEMCILSILRPIV